MHNQSSTEKKEERERREQGDGRRKETGTTAQERSADGGTHIWVVKIALVHLSESQHYPLGHDTLNKTYGFCYMESISFSLF